jgi:predicted ArsR family transcriptional regulator
MIYVSGVQRSDLERHIAAIASLTEPGRRSLYLYVVGRGERGGRGRGRGREVGRDEASRAMGISRALAAFHLDKLVEQGLLETSYRRLTGRGGPGAGRPAKLYRRSERQFEVSLPERRYELAARVFARALTDAHAPATERALRRAAVELGESLGAEMRPRAHRAGGRGRPLGRAVEVLAACGYEPARDDGTIRLHNCPFAAVANEYRDLVCGMNLALVRGMVRGAGLPQLTAVLDPQPGACCVVLKT